MKAARRYLGRRVIVNFADGSAIDGKLRTATADGLELAGATLRSPDARQALPVDGVVFVPASRVHWLNAEEE